MFVILVLSLFVLSVTAAKENKRAVYIPPSRPAGDVYFWESFSNKKECEERWIHSKASKDGTDIDIAKYDGQWSFEKPTHVGAFEEDVGLVMKVAAKHYAISAKLERPFLFDSDAEAFVLQYEANFQDSLSCGGAYIKLLSSTDDLDLTQFHDKTPYTIMFGPDRCGQSSKYHFIIRFKNPKTGEIEEKHSKQPTSGLENIFTDRQTHLYTLVVRQDDSYTLAIDQQVLVSGNLLKDLTPGVIPPEEIDDPNDKKPKDWDDREKIPDPQAVKPDDWDENAPQKIPDPDAVKPEGWLDDGPETIPDPDAHQPDDWDEEEDGQWEAPMIPNPACEEVGCGEWTPPMIANPAYKGKWRPPQIENPNYMGVWKAKRIPNPGFFELEGSVYSQLTPISAIGFELWSMNKDVYFDNIVIASQLTTASLFAKESWLKKTENERVASGSDSLGPWLDYFIEIANEYPYLWALYAVALVLPFVLCAACCVRSKPSDEAAKRKKTDEPTPDDPRPLEENPPTENKEEKKSESFVASSEEEEVDKKDPIESQEKEVEDEKPQEIETTEKDETAATDDGEQEFQTRKSPRRGKNRPQKEE